MSTEAKTLFEKVWERHVVVEPPGEPSLLYIDLHLIHEVTSPQAFEGLPPGRPQGAAGRIARLPRSIIMCHDDRRPAEHSRSDRGQANCHAAQELR